MSEELATKLAQVSNFILRQSEKQNASIAELSEASKAMSNLKDITKWIVMLSK